MSNSPIPNSSSHRPHLDVKPGRILIVDDAQVIRLALAALLRQHGHDVLEAVNGQQGLSLAPVADLILLDIDMPIMDGLEACRRIHHVLPDKPILIISGMQDAQTRVEGLEAGAVDYVTKPFPAKETILRIHAHLALAQARAAMDKQMALLERANSRMREDLQAAARIQMAMLPTGDISQGRLDAAMGFDPCDDMAGDGLGMLPLGPDLLACHVLDVMGHGVPAALLSVTLMHEINLILEDYWKRTGEGPDPALVLVELERRHAREIAHGQYATACLMLTNTQTGEVHYACAGHHGPVQVSRDGTITPHTLRAPPIGIEADGQYKSAKITLQPGDRLFLFTDGLFESRNPHASPFGRDRLIAAMRETRTLPLRDTIDAIRTAVHGWCWPKPVEDDRTMIAMEWN